MATTRPPSDRRVRAQRTTMALCLLAAVAFWLSIRLSDTYAHTEAIQLEYRLPVGVAFAQEPPTSVEATVRATGWELIAQSLRRRERRIVVDSADLRASPDGIVDLRDAVAGSFRSAGLSVDALTREQIALRTQPVSKRRVPVRLVTDLDYAPGFLSTRPPLLIPDSVTVSAPASLLDTVTYWPTDTLRLSGVRDTVLAVAVARRHPGGQLRVTPTRIEVTLVSQQVTEKSFYVPVQLGATQPSDSLRVYPRRVRVTCVVGLRDYASVTAQDFEAASRVPEGNLRVAADAPTRIAVELTRVPNNVRRVTVEPPTVELYRYDGGDQSL